MCSYRQTRRRCKVYDTYLTVADVATSICVSNAPSSSQLGHMVSMTNKLLLKLFKHTGIAEAPYQMTAGILMSHIVSVAL